MSWSLSPSPFQVWAADHESLQLTWGWSSAGQIEVTCADQVITIDHRGGPGSVSIAGLGPDQAYELSVVEADGRQHRIDGLTGQKPSGELLTRLATISDSHLGSRRWGFFKTMAEIESSHQGGEADSGSDRADIDELPEVQPGRAPGPYPRPYPWRCAHSAIVDAVDWGADLLILKGDNVHHETERSFDELGALVDDFPALPMRALPGNHDVDGGATVIPGTLGRRNLPIIRHVEHVDLPGVRLVLADTTVPGRGWGSLDRVGDDVVERAAEADRPVLVLIHQQLQPGRLPRHWPIGIPAPESSNFLDRLDQLTQPILVSSGHSHRNRVRHHGSVVVTEVASTKDWPGVWAGYNIFEGGIEQTVRRVSEPTAMAWTEYSRSAVGGLWARWAPGKLSDRCLFRTWSERLNSPV